MAQTGLGLKSAHATFTWWCAEDTHHWTIHGNSCVRQNKQPVLYNSMQYTLSAPQIHRQTDKPPKTSSRPQACWENTSEALLLSHGVQPPISRGLTAPGGSQSKNWRPQC